MKTLYELLGVGPDASDEAVKMAYRKLAKIHHPDLNPNDPDAARRFRQVSAAIAILCDAKRRAAYDQRLVRELQQRLDREIERHRLEWPRLLAISAAAGGVIGVVAVTGSILIGPVSPTSVFASATTRDAVHSPLSILAAPQESARRERSNDKIPSLPAIVLPASTSADERGAVAARPEQHCKQQTGSGLSREGNGPARLDVAGFEAEPRCETPKGREADERGLNANERAALIRHAQELLASGDTRTARVMMQRACRNSPSRCGPSSREEL